MNDAIWRIFQVKLQFENNLSNKVLHNEYSSQEDLDLKDLS